MPEAEPAPGERREWLSAHVRFSGGDITSPVCDDVVRTAIAPFVARCASAGWIDRHFFVRYADPDPHIRLRLHGPSGALADDVRPALPGWLEQATPARATVIGVEWAAYEPEHDRYGGPAGVELAEEVFHASSEAAFALLPAIDSRRSTRLGKGLLAMLVGMYAFHPNRKATSELAGRYATGYVRARIADEQLRRACLADFDSHFDQQAAKLTEYIDAAFDRLSAEEELSEALDAYHRAMAAARLRLHELFHAGRFLAQGQPAANWGLCLEWVVPSYLHMTSNRLGLTIAEESYLAHLIHRASDPRRSATA